MASLDLEDMTDTGYGETSQFAAHLDRGWALLDRGDLVAARTSVQHAQEVKPDDPDAAVLQGAIALAEGNPEESLRCYERALELDPEYLEPYTAAAQVCLFDLDDPGRALRYCEDALELEGLSAFDALDLQLLASECELGLGDEEGAAARLEGLAEIGALEVAMEMASSGDLPRADDVDEDRRTAVEFLTRDPDGEPLEDEERIDRIGRILQFAMRLARLRLEVGDIDGGLALLRELCERFPEEPDAWYLLSEAEHRHGDPRRAVVTALRTRELDAAGPLPDWVPSPAVVHRRLVQILQGAPDEALRELVAGSVALPVFVHDQPPAELVGEGLDPRVTVVALATKTGASSDDSQTTLTGIAVYRRNIARLCRDAEQFEQELRLSVYDEVATYLGLPDARRRALGLAGDPTLPEVQPEPVAPESEPVAEESPPRRGRRRSRAAN